MKKVTLITIIALLVFQSAHAQTRNVREKVSEDKSSSQPSSSGSRTSSASSPSGPEWDPDFENSFFGDLLLQGIVYGVGYAGFGVYKGFWHGQQAVMNHREDRPELVSLQGTLSGGFDSQHNTFMASPAIRGNYGIFASDLRYVHMRDVTGKLNAIDWQVLMLRLPIRSLKLEYGLGFSYFISPSKVYFEQSLGFDWGFLKNRAALQGQYRWSQHTNVGRYRSENAIDLDAEVARRGNLRFCPFVGYASYQYFDDISFDYIRLGLKVKLF
jgi:hypothetical protein